MESDTLSSLPLETHPWPPFIPDGARVLIMGTFPPPPARWGMNFYYPNPTNDFWPMMGLIFMGDRRALWDSDTRKFRLPEIKELLTLHHIALNDTGHTVRRLKGNASDKFLEIVEPVNLHALLESMPMCKAVATTGMKAAEVVASLTSTPVPGMGKCVTAADGLEIWRMPSTSRAYPMALADKAERYKSMFARLGII